MLTPVKFPWKVFVPGAAATITVHTVELIGAIPDGKGSYNITRPETPGVEVVFGVSYRFNGDKDMIERYLITDGQKHYESIGWGRGFNQADWYQIRSHIEAFVKATVDEKP